MCYRKTKLNQCRTPLQQLKDKAYADKYRAEGEPIHLIDVEFSKEQRSVTRFEVVTE